MVSLKEQIEDLKAELKERNKELAFMYSISDSVDSHGETVSPIENK